MYADQVEPMFVKDEKLLCAFQGMRTGVVFTNKRVFSIDAAFVASKKTVLSSFPYGEVRSFSLESGGALDSGSCLELMVTGTGSVEFEFVEEVDVSALCKMISGYTVDREARP